MRTRNRSFPRALAAGVAATACAALTLTAVPATAAIQPSAVSALQAKPVKLGQVKNLAAQLTKPGADYRVSVTWDALSGATSYKVEVSRAGTVVTSGRTTDHSWVATVPGTSAGQSVTVKVTAYAGKRPGKTASTTATAPDLTAPTGIFSLVFDEATLTAAVSETDVQDNVTPVGSIVREVDWGAGDGFELVTTAMPVTHTYDAKTEAYHPRIRLSDTASPANSAVFELATVVVNDATAPTGTFTVDRSTGWAKYTTVTITQVDINDDASNDNDISRAVAWGDGTTTQWTSGTTLGHVYRMAGTFVPTVTLTDEFPRTQDPYSLSAVVVKADTVDPTAKLVKPRKRIRPEVSSWVRLHGKTSDSAGSGVRAVKLRLIEKRHGSWYGYKATTKTWVKAATKAGAVKKSTLASVKPVSGTWKYRVRGLRQGVLVVKVAAKDNVGNTSTAKAYKQLLTRR